MAKRALCVIGYEHKGNELSFFFLSLSPVLTLRINPNKPHPLRAGAWVRTLRTLLRSWGLLLSRRYNSKAVNYYSCMILAFLRQRLNHSCVALFISPWRCETPGPKNRARWIDAMALRKFYSISSI